MIYLARAQFQHTYKVWNTDTGECVAILTSKKAADMLVKALHEDGSDTHEVSSGNVYICPEEYDPVGDYDPDYSDVDFEELF